MHELTRYKIMGRPTKLTRERVKLLEDAFAQGLNIAEACRYANISRQTYYQWIAKDQELHDRIEVLRHSPRLLAKLNIYRALQEGDVDVSRWLLERQDNEFNPKARLEINSMAAIQEELEQQVLKEEIAKFTNEELKMMLREAEKNANN